VIAYLLSLALARSAARMAELVDAHDSGSCDRKVVEVRVLFRAPRENPSALSITELRGFFLRQVKVEVADPTPCQHNSVERGTEAIREARPAGPRNPAFRHRGASKAILAIVCRGYLVSGGAPWPDACLIRPQADPADNPAWAPGPVPIESLRTGAHPVTPVTHCL
jgi:hypothetical protein